MRAYLTLGKRAETETIVHKSRFIGLAAPVSSAENALKLLDEIKQEHRGASHNCYAYIIGQNKGVMRYSDDGEPSGTAGKPIIEVMMAKDVVDCIVVVTRYFGGTLLGTGGLVRAYAHAAASALDKAGVCAMHESVRLQLKVAYPLWDRVDYALKALPVNLENTAYLETVHISMLCRSADKELIASELLKATDGKLIPQDDGDPFFHPWQI